jgi:spermidine/putrescine transport system substrate-binding protein
MTLKTDLSKREFIKHSTVAAGVLAMPMIFTSKKASADPVEINMLGWYGTAEPDMVAEFEAAENVKFVPKYYAGGDNMLAALAQNPPGTFDLIHTDAEYAEILIESELVDELDASAFPMDDLMHEDFANFPGHWNDGKLYSLITRYGHLGVSYNKDAVSKEEAMTYDVFWDPKLQGKVGHFDWHLPTLGEISLLNGNNNPSPFDINADQWKALQEKTLSLKPQVGGFFDFGGTFAGLKNAEMLAMVGIGDWVTGILERDGAPVSSVVPEEGGIQWTESYSIVSTSTKKDIVQKYIEYTSSPAGQVKSAQMLGYPGFSVSHAGRKLLNEVDPGEAQRTGQVNGVANDPVTLISEGKIHYRGLPKQQSLEDWNDFWSEYKNA